MTQTLTNCSHCGASSLPVQPQFSLLQRVVVRAVIDGGVTEDYGLVTGVVWDSDFGWWSYQVTFVEGVASSPWLPRGFSEIVPGDEVFALH